MKAINKNWYLAKLVYHIDLEKGNSISQFDEQYRLISSHTYEDAYLKARILGSEGESEFTNTKKEKIKWKFIDVAELQFLEEIKHGAELYSSTQEVDNPGEYIDLVKRKAMIIQGEIAMFI